MTTQNAKPFVIYEKRNGVPCVVLTRAAYEKQQQTAAEVLAALKRMEALLESLWDSIPWGKTFRLPVAELNEAPLQARRAIARAEGAK